MDSICYTFPYRLFLLPREDKISAMQGAKQLACMPCRTWKSKISMTYDISKPAIPKISALGKGTECVKIRLRAGSDDKPNGFRWWVETAQMTGWADSDEAECEKEKAIWIGGCHRHQTMVASHSYGWIIRNDKTPCRQVWDNKRGISHTLRHAYLSDILPTSHRNGWLPISHRYAMIT